MPLGSKIDDLDVGAKKYSLIKIGDFDAGAKSTLWPKIGDFDLGARQCFLVKNRRFRCGG